MTLDQILALHPKGADAATLRTAITTAEEMQASLRLQADTAKAERERNLLTRSDKELQGLERDAVNAVLAADRIAALLPAMRADLAAAEGREALDDLRAEAGLLKEAFEALQRWQATEFVQIKAMIGTGFRLEEAARNAHAGFVLRLQDAYARQEVRDAGPLGVPVPSMPGNLPREAFPNWQ
ncbi:hypothetical protein J8J14_09490 [Roseomonas sp. SSH11]|uniref:Uncharacterized protein n=1 Tax=Pararoseomonas baculiformis TaxID=2820812 RepID=A0ABS4ADC7_9PROT|nr:hypothetical protein [Pararoseomonas baculiformis]MBP0445012.1 hypothetical protein [Pararoseomonas baculiformis]